MKKAYKTQSQRQNIYLYINLKFGKFPTTHSDLHERI